MIVSFSCSIQAFFQAFLVLSLLKAGPQVILASKTAGINPNDNAHLSVTGLVETLFISIAVTIIIMILFEKYRFYKQIYLKRLQNRFLVRVFMLNLLDFK
jgi:hypothetical protein